MAIELTQEKVNELVDGFYEKLLKEPYYVSMFTERKVDIEWLKNRQRIFINRLISEGNSEQQTNQVAQVKDRHPFQIAPDRAEAWFGTMRETMEEMVLDDMVKEQLLSKIDFLLKKIVS
ncbi:globin domain-containing protein [Neobacillus dielmonensis]|uniref:globin domain-containing protein n=1 Tax=Neobacillus dielmonensis TaxID=1347369 RepID=UPI0005A71DF2|nr:protoglobin domain-containing protein [Neobacillus dielmonensis]